MVNKRYFVEKQKIMGTTQLREELHDFINKADERLLNLIYAMMQADMKEDDYQLSAAHKKYWRRD